MDSALPGCPRISFGIVGVRYVADWHAHAMTNTAAKGCPWSTPRAGYIITELGKFKNAAKARRVPGWTPRLREDAVMATAESLIEPGLLRNSRLAA